MYMSLLIKKILQKIKDLNTEIQKKNWITDTNNYTLTASNTTITIPYKFDEIDEFCFRILGSDASSFNYMNVPKDLWHNSGTYGIRVRAFASNGNTVAGWAQIACQNKTENNFQIKLLSQDCNAVAVGIKLK